MRQILRWVDRRFNFDLPAGLYPQLISRLRGAPCRAAELGRMFSVEDRCWRPKGRWSAQENVGHLIDLDGLWLARLQDYLEGRSVLTAWDVTNARTTEADHNARDWDDLVTDFATIRSEFVRRLDALAPADFERSALHPRLQQPMRLVDAIWFTAEHDDHHLASAWELLHRE